MIVFIGDGSATCVKEQFAGYVIVQIDRVDLFHSALVVVVFIFFTGLVLKAASPASSQRVERFRNVRFRGIIIIIIIIIALVVIIITREVFGIDIGTLLPLVKNISVDFVLFFLPPKPVVIN